MTFLLFLAGFLSTWRLTKAITEEEGPFRLFLKIRASLPTDGKRGWLGRGINCHWCVSFWIGLLIGLALTTPVIYGSFYGLAFSTLSITFDEVFEFCLRRLRK